MDPRLLWKEGVCTCFKQFIAGPHLAKLITQSSQWETYTWEAKTCGWINISNQNGKVTNAKTFVCSNELAKSIFNVESSVSNHRYVLKWMGNMAECSSTTSNMKLLYILFYCIHFLSQRHVDQWYSLSGTGDSLSGIGAGAALCHTTCSSFEHHPCIWNLPACFRKVAKALAWWGLWLKHPLLEEQVSCKPPWDVDLMSGKKGNMAELVYSNYECGCEPRSEYHWCRLTDAVLLWIAILSMKLHCKLVEEY